MASKVNNSNKEEGWHENRFHRQAILNKVFYPPQLPITDKKDEIVHAIGNNQVVIITGETGSGKTTQIPKMCLEAGRGKRGMIGCTQPRRLAAITVAGRIAEEMGESLGASVGYKIRFDDQTGARPFIKVMTDGILLMETQTDPDLSAYDTIIVDEAHERSLNIDFVLGFLKTILPKKRNLKVIITSATIDSEKFSQAFGGAPVIEVSGRTYPVEVFYRPPAAGNGSDIELSDPEAACLAAEELLSESYDGDILIFMATERDIRETCEILKGKCGSAAVLPLYARLPWQEQRRIFEPAAARKIIVATNIAETSLTIPGIRYVIDPGTARISHYNSRLRTNSLPVREISRSSCEQRKGRCGRVAKGICIRLYGEEDYNNRQLFTPPEIMRSNLAGVILKMLSLNIRDITSFPFIDRPPQRSFQDGLETLRELGAVQRRSDGQGEWELTANGRLMARIPLDPRLSRMIIAARAEGCLEEITVIAAALSLSDPRERPAEKEKEADRAQASFQDPASDFLTLLNIWKGFQGLRNGNNSRGKARKYCRDHFLSYKRMREWQDVHEQVKQILKEQHFQRQEGSHSEDYQLLYAAIHKSILSGYLSNIAIKKEKNFYQASKGREIMLFPGSGLFNKGGSWIVAAEIIETSRIYGRICANIDSGWLEALGGDLCRSTYAEPRWEKNRGEVVASEQKTLFGLVIVPRRAVSYGPVAPEEAGEIFIREALVPGEIRHPLPFLRHNQKLLASIAALEDRVRRADLLVPDEMIARFYEQRLKGIYNTKTLQKLIKDRGGDDFLRLQESDLLAALPHPDELALFPEKLKGSQEDFPLVYRFAPGEGDDGVTVRIPLHSFNLLEPLKAEWLVPGLLREKINSLLKALPKEYRKKLMPLNRTCEIILKEMTDREGHFLTALAKFVCRRFGIDIPAAAWPLDGLPEHLRMRFALLDAQNREVAAGRDLSLLQAEVVDQIRTDVFEECRKKWERQGIKEWNFGRLPESIRLEDKSGVAGLAYPALSPAGDSVEILLFRDKDESDRRHREGVITLFTLHFAEELKYLKKNLSLTSEMKLLSQHFGGPKAIEKALYGRTLKNLFGTEIRTAEEFSAHAAQVRPLILPEGEQVRKTILPVLKACHEADAGLRSLVKDNRANGPALQFLGELQAALARLAPHNFLEDCPYERFLHLPRYLRALMLGAQRGLLHLDKAMGKIREIRLLTDELQDMLDQAPPYISDEKRKVMDEYFWMLEEYRVSLFAQELKTPFPVSRKKLDEKLLEIKRLF